MTDRLIGVRYVGKKPSAYDSVARSGAIWNCPGDVQEVTDAQAKLLIKYPDQWQLANPDDADAVNTPISITVIDEDGDSVAIDPDKFKLPLERINEGFDLMHRGESIRAVVKY